MHDRKLRAVWEDCFRPALTRPGFISLVVVLSGWVLTEGTHAVTAALVATDVARRRHWASFHRFFSRGTWDPDVLGEHLFRRILRAQSCAVRVVIDDTLAVKKGPKIFGLGNHLDPVRSTKRQKVFAFGHCWVVLAVLVTVPFSGRAWALPVLFRLYRNIKDCERRRVPHKKKTELAADGAYCNDTLARGLAGNVVFFGSMRPDAVLTSQPKAAEKCGGRPRKRGELLRKPSMLARDGRTSWSTAHPLLYGKVTRVRYKQLDAQWYRAMGTRLLRIIVVECATGRIPLRVFFSSDPTLSVEAILETYAGRWGIEVFFRDAKQSLGFADSQATTESALRTAPLIGLLYSSLVLWCADGIYVDAIASPPLRPWYRNKRRLAFIDVLRAAQRALVRTDVLDPRSYSDDLQQSSALRPHSARSQLDPAA